MSHQAEIKVSEGTAISSEAQVPLASLLVVGRMHILTVLGRRSLISLLAVDWGHSQLLGAAFQDLAMSPLHNVSHIRQFVSSRPTGEQLLQV